MPRTLNLENPTSLRDFRRNLLTWYQYNKRPLPWRKTRNPYRIWISEIMLQQTRVTAVLDHYKRFLQRFSTVRRLAVAKEADVLSAWSGLGYYRRARMLHRAAKLVIAEHSGRIPENATELRTLPGIGRYTSNAIASIAFGEPVAVVDGNVERVLARLLRKKVRGEDVWQTAQALLDRDCPGDFNQAMMELGATICVPGVPVCERCPVSRHCASQGLERETNSVSEKRVRRSSSRLLVRRGGALLLSQRGYSETLMPGMWELPEASNVIDGEPLLNVRHSITTNDWMVRVFSGQRKPIGLKCRWVALTQASHLPLTGLTRKILRKLSLLS